MKFHIGETMTPTANLLPLARATERLGFDGFTVSDSIIFPAESETSYSYTDDGSRDFLANKEVVESFVLASAIAGATERIEITTSVVKLPVRHPVYAAKLASSLHAISNGRFNFGVGLSVWPEDYSVLGVEYANRGKRFDECLEIVKGLSAGEFFEFHGEFFDIPQIRQLPAAPGLPIIIGGHSDAALKRAARFDGWSSAGSSADELRSMIAKIQEYRAALGLEGPFRIFETYFDGWDRDLIAEREEIGVTDLIVQFRNIYQVDVDQQPIEEKIAMIENFASKFINV